MTRAVELLCKPMMRPMNLGSFVPRILRVHTIRAAQAAQPIYHALHGNIAKQTKEVTARTFSIYTHDIVPRHLSEITMSSTAFVPFSEPPYIVGLPSPYYKETHLRWQKACRKF